MSVCCDYQKYNPVHGHSENYGYLPAQCQLYWSLIGCSLIGTIRHAILTPGQRVDFGDLGDPAVGVCAATVQNNCGEQFGYFCVDMPCVPPLPDGSPSFDPAYPVCGMLGFCLHHYSNQADVVGMNTARGCAWENSPDAFRLGWSPTNLILAEWWGLTEPQVGNDPFWPHCGDTPPVTPCCGCDWCCDGLASAECLAIRSGPRDRLPSPGPPNSDCGTAPTCGLGNRIPQCEGDVYLAAKLYPGQNLPAVLGRHAFTSERPVRPVDLASNADECRVYSAYVAKSVLPPRHAPLGCGQYNRRQMTTRETYACAIRKRPNGGGRHEFVCAHRRPCPETPSPCN